MKVRILELDGYNTGRLKEKKKCNNAKELCGVVKIEKGRFYRCDLSSPLIGKEGRYYHRNHSLKFGKKIIYGFHEFGVVKDGTLLFVGFNFWQHHRFLLKQGDHWFQQEKNIRFIIGIVLTIIGLLIAYKKIQG